MLPRAWRVSARLAGAALLGLLLAIGLASGRAHAQDPVVQPGDVATPTPTPVLAPGLPTPTPQPWPDAGSVPTTGPVPFASPALLPGPLPTVTLLEPVTTAGDKPPMNTAGDLPPLRAGQEGLRTYTVRPGDTLFTVALETGLDLDDVPCTLAPTFTPDQPLVIGDTLTVPPANIACHTVLAGENLAVIAAQYGSTADQVYLLPWNRLTGVPFEQVTLAPGLHLRVPLPLPEVWTPGTATAATPAHQAFLPQMLNMPVDSSPFLVLGGDDERAPARSLVHGPVPADWPYGSGHFVWPVYGWLSQSYRYDHRAVDIAAVVGTPVTAADRGVVVRAGWNDQGYGRFVVIDHQIDYVTLYAHLDKILVEEGDIVGQGQVLGTVGSTGNSTGPHLHFEIRDFGSRTNPLELLAAR